MTIALRRYFTGTGQWSLTSPPFLLLLLYKMQTHKTNFLSSLNCFSVFSLMNILVGRFSIIIKCCLCFLVKIIVFLRILSHNSRQSSQYKMDHLIHSSCKNNTNRNFFINVFVTFLFIVLSTLFIVSSSAALKILKVFHSEYRGWFFWKSQYTTFMLWTKFLMVFEFASSWRGG